MNFLNLDKQYYLIDHHNIHNQLDLHNYNKKVFVDGVFGHEELTISDLITRLEKTYCEKIGLKFKHIQEKKQRDWIMQKFENISPSSQFTDIGKKAILERLTAAEKFEQFLDKKYTGTKRFGLEGGESLLPALEQILKHGGI